MNVVMYVSWMYGVCFFSCVLFACLFLVATYAWTNLGMKCIANFLAPYQRCMYHELFFMNVFFFLNVSRIFFFHECSANFLAESVVADCNTFMKKQKVGPRPVRPPFYKPHVWADWTKKVGPRPVKPPFYKTHTNLLAPYQWWRWSSRACRSWRQRSPGLGFRV
jgi:hypothetical protein